MSTPSNTMATKHFNIHCFKSPSVKAVPGPANSVFFMYRVIVIVFKTGSLIQISFVKSMLLYWLVYFVRQGV